MLNASILKKVLMAITGLAWFGFLISHLSANLMIYRGAETFNAYPEMLRSFGPLLYVAEAGLVLLLLGHVVAGIRATLENKGARDKAYDQHKTRISTLASRTMVLSGVILLVYIPAHIWQFKFGNWEMANGLWGLVVLSFKNPLIAGLYVLASLAVGMHLSHGLASAFQTLGLGKPVWRKRLQIAGFLTGWIIAGGFASLPIWCYLVPSP